MLMQAMARMKCSRQNKGGNAKDNGICEATLAIPASSQSGKIASDQLRSAVANGDQQIQISKPQCTKSEYKSHVVWNRKCDDFMVDNVFDENHARGRYDLRAALGYAVDE
jgi:hypothetical protein